ncbi:MAG TPA: hypothetical protein DDW58_08355 [Clostridiaceae bacterium]|nr:hypothetical protein [Clostridiaceae bacterium]HBN27551.1 hypothetical protein [Clostridiaceae bacterium]
MVIIIILAILLPDIISLIYSMMYIEERPIWGKSKLDKAEKINIFITALIMVGMLTAYWIKGKGNTALANYIFYILIIAEFISGQIFYYLEEKVSKSSAQKNTLIFAIIVALIIAIDMFYKPIPFEKKLIYILPLVSVVISFSNSKMDQPYLF